MCSDQDTNEQASEAEPLNAESLMRRVRIRQEERQRRAQESAATYRRSIVTFIDILGFREIVRSRTSAEIGHILAILEEVGAGEADRAEHAAGLARSITFSDSVVRVCPVDTDDQVGALFFELNSLVHMQMELADMGVFLRGGLTIGDVFLSEGRIFGPAMVRAYDLETSFAIYPRIVVDPIVVERYFLEPALQGGAHDLETDIEYLNRQLAHGDDQLYYVDYLRAMSRELDNPDEYPDVLLRHREFVLNAAQEITSFNSAKHKYFWLAQYHNSVVDQLHATDELKEQLRLDAEDLGEVEYP